ncbi:helix-turn-helix domain-containing protein [Candidatus Omnitrophota bacterium]
MEYLTLSRNPGPYHSAVEATEKSLIEETLERTFGNQLRAARLLGINRNTIRNKIRKLGIQVKRRKR